MARITATPRIDMDFQFNINYREALALDALAGYGDDAFIKAFYETLGKAYMEKYEDGLRSFLKSIRSELNPTLSRMQKAARVLSGECDVVKKETP